MKDTIERLRELVRRADSSEHYWQQQASAMEFAAHGDWLLDRLEKLEAENALYVGVTKALHEEREKNTRAPFRSYSTD
jgi:hypothetical protein